jgi:hypothetical protein
MRLTMAADFCRIGIRQILDFLDLFVRSLPVLSDGLGVCVGRLVCLQ